MFLNAEDTELRVKVLLAEVKSSNLCLCRSQHGGMTMLEFGVDTYSQFILADDARNAGSVIADHREPCLDIFTQFGW